MKGDSGGRKIRPLPRSVPRTLGKVIGLKQNSNKGKISVSFEVHDDVCVGSGVGLRFPGLVRYRYRIVYRNL